MVVRLFCASLIVAQKPKSADFFISKFQTKKIKIKKNKKDFWKTY